LISSAVMRTNNQMLSLQKLLENSW